MTGINKRVNKYRVNVNVSLNPLFVKRTISILPKVEMACTLELVDN